MSTLNSVDNQLVIRRGAQKLPKVFRVWQSECLQGFRTG